MWGRAQLGLAVLGGVAVCAIAADAPRHPMSTAYHDGVSVPVVIEPGTRHQRVLTFGPWQLGVLPPDRRPRDKRLNLYVAVPGKQHHIDGWDDYDHNMIINAVPKSDDAVEWDVYWVLTLDPHMYEDVRSERDLLIAAQTRFLPGDLFEFDDIPADTVLRDYLHIRSLEDLRIYRQKDGTLPRILVLPADCVVRMKVEEEAAPPTH